MFSQKLINFALSQYNFLIESIWLLKLVIAILIAIASPVDLNECLSKKLTNSLESLNEDSKKKLTLKIEEFTLILWREVLYTSRKKKAN